MAAAQSELSMDEILASIRRIIHEEEDPKNERPRDTTNTVNLRDKQAEPAQPSDILAETEAKDVREVKLTSDAETKAEPAPQATEAVATMEPDAVATEAGEVLNDTFDTAGIRALVSDEVANQKVSARPLAKPPQEEPREQQAATQSQPEESPSEPQKSVEPEAKAAQSSGAAEAVQPKPASAPAEDPAAAAAAQAFAQKSREDALAERVVQSLLGGSEAQGISAAFAGLKKTVEIASSAQPRTLEDMVEAMLRPMLKDWLEANLRPMVEAKVDAEIKRLTGQ